MDRRFRSKRRLRAFLVSSALILGALLVSFATEENIDTGSTIIVRDENGQRISSASLKVGATYAEASVMALGNRRGIIKASLDNIREGGSVWVESDGFAPTEVDPATLRHQTTVVLVPGVSLEGVVRDPLGGFVAQAIVRAQARGVARVTITDKQGRFTMSGLRPGSLVITASAPTYYGSERTLSVAPGSQHSISLPLSRPLRLVLATNMVGSSPESSSLGGRISVRAGASFPQELKITRPASGQPAKALFPMESRFAAGSNTVLELPGGVPLALWAVFDGHAPSQQPLVVTEDGQTIQLYPAPGGSLRGRFVNEDSEPLAKVELTVVSVDEHLQKALEWAELPRVASDPRGAWELAALPPGRMRIALAKKEWLLPRLSPLVVAVGGTTDAGTILLRQGKALAGVVMDKVTKEAVDAASIKLSRELLGTLEPRTTTSDHQGRFRLEGLESGAWSIEVTHASHAPLRKEALRPGDEDLRLELEPGGAIEGWLVDPSGDPVSTARATLRRPGALGPPLAVQDLELASGRFTLSGLPAVPLTINFSSPGYAPTRVGPVALSSRYPVDLDQIVLRTGRRLTGRVVDLQTSPVEGVRLEVFDHEQKVCEAALSDVDGKFEIVGVPRHGFKLLATRDGLAPTIIRVPGRLATPRQEQEEGLIIPMFVGARVFGEVLGESAHPLAGARVSVPYPWPESLSAVTDLKGRYELTHVPPGTRQIRMVADPGMPETWIEDREVDLDEDGSLQLDFRATASVSGTVRRSGFPVAWATLAAVPAGPAAGVTTTQADDQGAFRLTGLRPGTWTIHVWTDHCQARFPYLRHADAASDRLDLVLPPGDLAGWVVEDESSDPIVAAEVAWSGNHPPGTATYRFEINSSSGANLVLEDSPFAGAMTKSGGDGSFRLCVPGAGDLSVEINAGSDYVTSSRDLHLPAPAPVEIRVSKKQHPIIVRVLGPDGSILANPGMAMVVIEHAGGFYSSRTLGAGGEARFERPAEAFRLWAGISGIGVAMTEWFDPQATLPSPLDLPVRPGGSIRLSGLGQLAEAHGKAPEEIDLRLTNEQGDDLWRWSRLLNARSLRRLGGGEILVGSFPCGSYSLSWSIGDAPPRSSSITIGADAAFVDLSD